MAVELYLGEKLETIILARRDMPFGKYMGDSAKTFGAARIDGVIYKIRRNLDLTQGWFWKVLNVNTGDEVTLQERYDLLCLQMV